MSPTAQDRSSMDLDEAIQSLPLELREKIYKDFVSRIMRERKEKGWKEVHKGVLVETKIRERKRMGWNGVHHEIEGAPFFACDHFYYTDEYLSNFEREEIQKVDARVLEQLLQQPLQEEEQPQQEESQNTSLQEELEDIEETEPEALLNLMVDYLLTKQEDLVKVEEEVKKVSPAVMGELTKNKSAIVLQCRKLLRQARNSR